MMGIDLVPPDMPAPDAGLFASLLALTTDPAAASARLAELQKVSRLASDLLGHAKAALAGLDGREKNAVDREASLADREIKISAKETDLKKREEELAFRERHVSDLVRKAIEDARAAATARADLERKLSNLRKIASPEWEG